MSVKIYIHKTHRQHTGGQEMIEVSGQMVGDCLDALVDRHPEMEKILFDGGKLNKLIEIYLNMESAYPDELLKPTKDGDEIHITLLLSGG